MGGEKGEVSGRGEGRGEWGGGEKGEVSGEGRSER